MQFIIIMQVFITFTFLKSTDGAGNRVYIWGIKNQNVLYTLDNYFLWGLVLLINSVAEAKYSYQSVTACSNMDLRNGQCDGSLLEKQWHLLVVYRLYPLMPGIFFPRNQPPLFTRDLFSVLLLSLCAILNFGYTQWSIN